MVSLPNRAFDQIQSFAQSLSEISRQCGDSKFLLVVDAYKGKGNKSKLSVERCV